ncbi:hypothetical protein [Paucibacter sp. M5-1]|uniref:hypothetical protein n=1 Tax=Paucibacter sp. M5-1 TaxID=3015998 RepID=UPI003F81A439
MTLTKLLLPPARWPATLRLRRRHGLLLSGALLTLMACSSAERAGQLPCLKAQLGRFSAKLVLSWHCKADSAPARPSVPRLSAASR